MTTLIKIEHPCMISCLQHFLQLNYLSEEKRNSNRLSEPCSGHRYAFCVPRGLAVGRPVAYFEVPPYKFTWRDSEED